MSTQINNKIVMVATDLLTFNQTLLDIYSTPENYNEIKENIKEVGVIQPLLVNLADMCNMHLMKYKDLVLLEHLSFLQENIEIMLHS